ncbi:hypothetical protein [Streptomyces malaysiensis]|uniref:hypothetical protein n=1 Tax=Streptomyces malaysiensis TaxID=92644 RepID=UPI000853B46F|nr:hypothetical protein [Streptomyces sp. SPMA113]
MTDVWRLDLIVGQEQAAGWMRSLATDLAHQDQIPYDTALRLVCDRASDSEPRLLAAPGQVWSLHPDADPDEAPCPRLAILARLTAPPRVLVTDPDDSASEVDELLIEALDLYQLQTWQSADVLLDGGGIQ